MKSNSEILAELNTRVYGHESVKKTLINILNRSKIRYLQIFKDLKLEKDLIPKQNCLLVGSSGTGKTFLVNELSKVMDFPFMIFDLSKINSIGCSGGGITGAGIIEKINAYAKALFEHSSNVGKYHSQDGVLAQMVIFLDEIDKLTIHCYQGNWEYKIQTEILSIFEGNKKFKNLTVIAAGAFKDITMEKVDERKPIGFCTSDTKDSTPKEEKEIDRELLNLGMCPELLGRIGTICQLDVFTEKDYKKVLEERLYPKFISDLKTLGIVDFEMQNSQMEKIVKDAMDSNTGIRGLQKHLNKLSNDLEFNSDTLLNYRGDFNHDYKSKETNNPSFEDEKPAD